jgi:GTP-binding protein LepA
MDPKYIRNFSIIAHIDHGKSTLADRIMQITGAVTKREEQAQLLDSMDIERERGITIKAASVTMDYQHEGQNYMINLIDTPGHVDFHYEVSRAMAACEGALLVVDATQGVEAQTVANAYLAIESNLEIIPVLNKVDLPSAMPDVICEEVENLLGCDKEDCYSVSAKSGMGVDKLMHAVITLLPPPDDNRKKPLRALIYDAVFDDFRGVICYVRVFGGKITTGDKIHFMGTDTNYVATELGKFTPKMKSVNFLSSGEVGYIIANIRGLGEVNIGDTITHQNMSGLEALPGYEPPMQMVFSDFYPGNETDFTQLRNAFEKLQVNDASFTYQPQTSPALGFGFRCGFLGLLHMEIIQERLERESKLDVIQTAPTVSYEIVKSDGEELRVDSPSQLPDPSVIAEYREPYVKLEIITPKEYVGDIMKLAGNRRCILEKTEYLSTTRVLMDYIGPLAEIVYDFYDVLKGISRGYATMDYEFTNFVPSNLVKLDILVNKMLVDALSLIVHRTISESRGRKLLLKLKKIIPRHNFEVPLQACIGGKIIARETIKGYRKDVTAKLYGGDITRKMKVLKKQKEGKKRMKAVGSVNIPQEAFMSIMKTDES